MSADRDPAVASTASPILDVQGLSKRFQVGGLGARRHLDAVREVSFSVAAGECLGLVGESGSGKTTAARCVLRLIEPTAGTVRFDGEDLTSVGRTKIRSRYRGMQMVFQDPNSSLNPRMTIEQIVTEPLRLHLKLGREERRARSVELMELVGLTPGHLDRFPAQLSGGQRQRIGIARAIATRPKLVFLDEPTSSLDVSVRGQVLQLLIDLQAELSMTYVMISHDLGVVRRVCNRVVVMLRGQIVERGPTADVFDNPTNPYTKQLLAAVPSMYGYQRRRHQEVDIT